MSLKSFLQDNSTVQQWLERFQTMSERDRLALIMLAIFLGLLILLFLVIQPARHFYAHARANYLESQETVHWMQANRDLAGSSQGSAELLTADSLLGVANTTSKEFNLAIKRIEPVGEKGLTVWLEGVAFNNVVLWLDSLTKRYQVVIKEVAVDRSADNGSAVNVRLIILG